MNTQSCGVCQALLPVELLNDHHRIPASKGGADSEENYARICPACHQNLHRVAELIVNGKQDRADAIIAMVYAKDPARKAFLSLVKQILESEYQEKTDETIVLPLELPQEAYRRLKVLAYEHRHPGTNRRVGVARFCQTLLLNHLKIKGQWPPQESKTTLQEVMPSSLQDLLK